MQGVRDKRLYFLVNPKAAGGQAVQFWQQLLPRLEACGFDFIWEFSCADKVEEQVHSAVAEQGAQVVVPFGGDGTLNDAVNGLLEADRPIREDLVLAAFPAGSACDFVRTVYPKGCSDLIDLLQNGSISPLDVGRCAFGSGKVRYFINSFDVGIGADTCAAVNNGQGRIKRLLRNGPLAFKLSALKEILSFRYTVAHVQTEDAAYDGEYLIAGCGNGRYIGGNMKMFPRAQVDDGLLDLLLVPKMSTLRTLKMFSRAYDGSVIRIPGVIYCQTPWAELETQRSICAELDGEILGNTPMRVSLLQNTLSFLSPQPLDSEENR